MAVKIREYEKSTTVERSGKKSNLIKRTTNNINKYKIKNRQY